MLRNSSVQASPSQPPAPGFGVVRRMPIKETQHQPTSASARRATVQPQAENIHCR